MTIKINGDNTVANPGFSGDDTDTGLQVGTNELKLVTGGTARATVDSSGKIGIGTTSPQRNAHFNSSTTEVALKLTNSTSGSASGDGTDIKYEGLNLTINNREAGAIIFETSNTFAASIDSSGNVGIGTTSPGRQLEVFGSTASFIRLNHTGLSSSGLDVGYSSAGYAIINNTENTALAFQTNNTERMRIDSSGNVGIGTTSPSEELEISSATPALKLSDTDEANSYGTVSMASSVMYLQANGAASNGQLIYRSGNAGTFTERLRIDTSGRLLVGTTTAPGSGLIQAASTAGAEISLARDDASVVDGNQLGRISWFGNDGGTYQECGRITCAADGTHASSDKPSRLVFSTTADGGSSPTERMRITSQGATWAGVNTTIEQHGSSIHYHGWSQNNNSQWVATFRNLASSGGYGVVISHPNSSTSNTTYQFLNCNNSAGNKAIIYTNGGLANYQSNNSNLCDEREKKNIETLDSTWGCLKNWELKKFHYNEDADTDDKRYGVIAQQVEQHCPEVITDWTKQTAQEAVLDDDGNVVTPAREEILRKGVKEQQMMWMAIKALQEAQDRIETLETQNADLTARITALETA